MRSFHIVSLLALAGTPACTVISPDLLGPPGAGTPDAPAPIDAPGPGTPDAQVHAFPTTGLLVNYEFEDGTGTQITDSASRHLNATLTDPSMWTLNGRNGKGISMAGGVPPTQYVNLPSGIVSGVSDFTISAWVRLSGNPIPC